MPRMSVDMVVDYCPPSYLLRQWEPGGVRGPVVHREHKWLLLVVLDELQSFIGEDVGG